MNSFIDPSEKTPLFTAQQVTCAYPISDFYASTPRYLYYALLVSCLLIRWHPWLSDVFLGAAATYAGVAAIEAFILLAGYPDPSATSWINIPYIDRASVPGNEIYAKLPNLITNLTTLGVQPAVMELDIDGILAIVVTGYLFMLPVHCWSTHVRGHRARHLLMGLWNVLMLCATVCALILWVWLGDVPYQFRFCYPEFPDLDTITNDGWVSSLWSGSWNSTIWTTFTEPQKFNQLTENCMYPCFNTSQVLRRPTTIVASLFTNRSPRTDNALSDVQAAHQTRLADFMIVAIVISALTAIVLFIVTATGMDRFTAIPLHQPVRLWTDRKAIKENILCDIKSFTRRPKRKTFWRTEKDTATTVIADSDTYMQRHQALFRIFANIIASVILFIVVVIIPGTWIIFITWIEWWIHRDLVSQETPKQIGQWATTVSVALVLISALVMRLKYRIASREEVEKEIEELDSRLNKLRTIRDRKS